MWEAVAQSARSLVPVILNTVCLLQKWYKDIFQATLDIALAVVAVEEPAIKSPCTLVIGLDRLQNSRRQEVGGRWGNGICSLVEKERSETSRVPQITRRIIYIRFVLTLCVCPHLLVWHISARSGGYLWVCSRDQSTHLSVPQ